MKNSVLSITLNREEKTPLNRQLYDELTKLILSGELKPGSRLPASRALAEQLGISRPTVIACLEQLEHEGYVETRRNAGSFVSPNISRDALQHAREKRSKKRSTAAIAEYELSEYGRFVSMAPDPVPVRKEPEFSFYCWRPALDQFPLSEWARVLGRHARNSDLKMLDSNSDPQGLFELREALAKLVKRFRHVSCTAEQVFPVMGLNQGLDLVSRLHVGTRGGVIVEEPGYLPAAFRACGAKLFSVPVDQNGLQIEKLPAKKNSDRFSLVYVTPAHQFPTGAVMPLARRLELLAWAKQHEALVLEDDFDSEYQSSGQPIPALMSLDRDQRVIYLGTLNQIMFPSLGLGYLIVPTRFVALYRKARNLAGEQMPTQVQAAVAEFINDGHLERQVKKLRVLYSERRTVLVRALEKSFGNKVSLGNNRRGMFLSLIFNITLTDDEILKRAEDAGVGLTSARDFYCDKPQARQFIMGFGNLNEREIELGVRKLAKALL